MDVGRITYKEKAPKYTCQNHNQFPTLFFSDTTSKKSTGVLRKALDLLGAYAGGLDRDKN